MSSALAVARPLTVGPHTVDPPVVLAPMAGITNVAFRRLCREHGAGLYVSEMITTRALVERNQKTMSLITFAPDEQPRSIQLYGVDPDVVGRAVDMVVQENLADHVDLNFGCPVPKVTRKGGGSALPFRRKLFAQIVQRAVRATAGTDVPITVKMRIGIDDDHITFRDAGRAAEDAGVTAVALHGRTAVQFYGGRANWEPIAELAAALDVPVLGNGDIWEADDAVRMVTETGCAGVVVGRGCLGRPWLFADLAAAFAGRPERVRPHLGEVAVTMRRHAELLAEWKGEAWGLPDFRKHVAWYLKGYPAGSTLRRQLGMVSTLAELDDLLAQLDPDAPFPTTEIGEPRGRTTGARRVVLPEGWLDDPDALTAPTDAELDVSGG
ncbi:tRNA dihydrouridine synthase DusB [Cryptosporangium sp. NPDC048952]|uniref:tRNA dihydrouridine synthase DusB n=1 Tax=Cryptosporangium sp. NPDC048952 TaxID=3363961 RepID=UPI003716C663